jgi:hypothetical protein
MHEQGLSFSLPSYYHYVKVICAKPRWSRYVDAIYGSDPKSMVAKPLALSIVNKGMLDYDPNKSWRLQTKIHYNSMEKRWIYSIKMLSIVPLNVVDASNEDRSSSSSNSGGAAARTRHPPRGDLHGALDLANYQLSGASHSPHGGSLLVVDHGGIYWRPWRMAASVGI